MEERIFFIVKAIESGNQCFLEYPFSEDFFKYLKKSYQDTEDYCSKKDDKEEKDDENIKSIKTYLKLKHPEDFPTLSDISIGDKRYISLPVRIKQADYFDLNLDDPKRKNEQTKDRKRIYKYPRIEMFNIVVAINKEDSFYHKKEIVERAKSKVREFSRLMTKEEYQYHKLGKELNNLIRFYESFLSMDDKDYNFNSFIKQLPNKTTLFGIIEDVYEQIMSVKSNKKQIKLKGYHALTLIKQRKFMSILGPNINSNKEISTFIRNLTPLITLSDAIYKTSCEEDFLYNYSANLVRLGYAKIGFPVKNYSIFRVNFYIDKAISIERKEIMRKSNMKELLSVFEKNETEGVEQLFEREFSKKYAQNEFLNKVTFLLSNELIVQCYQFVSCLLQFKKEYKVDDYTAEYIEIEEVEVDSEFEIQAEIENSDFDMVKEEKFPPEEAPKALEQKEEEAKEEGENEAIYGKKSEYYEDFLEEIKEKEPEHYKILSEITPLIYGRLCIDEISYASGRSYYGLLDIFKKYSNVFILIITPLN